MDATTTMEAAKVKERPILFRGEMVKAILDGVKTQTRRLIKPQPHDVSPSSGKMPGLIRLRETDPTLSTFGTACPYGAIGDRLWVRETWKAWEDPKTLIDGILFQADGAFQEIESTREAAELWMEAAHRKPAKSDYKPLRGAGCGYLGVAVCKKHVGWRPSIFMPRSVCRLVLEITDVRVERLYEISMEDGFAEGFTGRAGFLANWGRHNKPEVTSTNPWVWVVSFRRIEL